LGEVVEKLKSYSLSRDVETTELTGYRYIHYGDIHKQIADMVTKDEQLPNIKKGDYISIEQGDLVLADASEDYIGIAEPCVILHKPKNKIIAGLHTIAIRPLNTNHLFLYYLFHTDGFKKFGGYVGTGLKVFGITYNNLSRYETRYPTLPEQTTIGNFFRTLENAIAFHKHKCICLKKLKKGYLQQMFPQNGESVPKIRFKGFTGDWEVKKLGEIVNWSKGQGLSKDELNENGIGTPALHYADLYKFNAVEKKIIHWTESTSGRIIPNNSILFPMSDVTPDGLARTTTLTINGVKAGGDVLIGELCKNIISIFISYQVNANYKAILPFVTGTTVKHINASSLSELDVFIPTIKEQIAIGNFFYNLDEQITTKQVKIEKLKQLKTAYLQKMFI